MKRLLIKSFFIIITPILIFVSYANSEQLNDKQLDTIALGKSLFSKPWVTGLASTSARDGLGPLFNTNACINCHVSNGRGKLFTQLGKLHPALVVRLNGNTVFGKQLNTFSSDPTIPAEGRASLTFKARRVNQRMLREPQIEIDHPNFKKLAGKPILSARVAPSLIGLGLLEKIPHAEIMKNSNDHLSQNQKVKNRCIVGYKTQVCGLEQQIASAAYEDMGLTSPYHPLEKNQKQRAVQSENAKKTQDFDISLVRIRAIAEYIRYISTPKSMQPKATPKRLNNQVGYRLMRKTQCLSCHRAEYKIASGYIYPFTDLLSHDMGESLASSPTQTGRKWRTAPLWNIAKQTNYLHDGRAKNIEEAILWHAGKAKQSSVLYQKLSTKEKQQLIDFINAL